MRLLVGLLLFSGFVAAQEVAKPAAPPALAPAASHVGTDEVTIPEGTRIPVMLKNAISTKSSRVGDPIYAQSTFPVVVDERIVVPAGTYVQGKISQIKPAGHLNGELNSPYNVVFSADGTTAYVADTGNERIAIFKEAVEERGRVFDPLEVGVARAFYVAKSQTDKDAALERRMEAQRRLEAISNPPGGKSKASIMTFSDTREASEESALYGTPDEIAQKLEKLRGLGVEYVLLNGGGLVLDKANDNLSRFAREVMPAFADEAKVRVVG